MPMLLVQASGTDRLAKVKICVDSKCVFNPLLTDRSKAVVLVMFLALWPLLRGVSC